MADALTIGLINLRDKCLRIAAAAVVATVILELMMRVGAPNMMGIPPMSPTNLITNIFGLSQGHVFGTIVHYGLALVVFPIGYIFIAYRNFPGSYLVRGALWGVLLWLVAMAVVLPLAGVPFFFGFEKPTIASLIAHIAYGIILAAIIGKPQ